MPGELPGDLRRWPRRLVAEENSDGRPRHDVVDHLGDRGDGGELGGELGTEAAALLALANQIAEPAKDAGRNGPDDRDRPFGFVFCQFAGDDPRQVGVLQHELDVGGEEPADRIHRGDTGGEVGAGDGDHAVEAAGEDLVIEGFLVVEVVVEEGRIDLGVGTDLLDGGSGESMPGKEGFGGVEDGSAGLGGGRHRLN